MQTLLNVLLVIAVIGIVFAVVTGRIAGAMDDPTTSIPPRSLPDGPVTAHDVAGLRFVPAFRGYRMSQVDAALTRLEEEIARRDAELAALRPAPAAEADADADADARADAEAESEAEAEAGEPAADAAEPAADAAEVPAGNAGPVPAVAAAEAPAAEEPEEPVAEAVEEPVADKPAEQDGDAAAPGATAGA